MKLGKNRGAKAAIVAAAAGLFVFFFGLVRADPQVKAEPDGAAATPPPDYGRLFREGLDDDDDRYEEEWYGRRATSRLPPASGQETPSSSVQPHTRTRPS